MEWIWILIIVAVVATAIHLSVHSQRIEEAKESLGASETFPSGDYLGGIPEASGSVEGVTCAVTDSDFVFLMQYGEEFARIPRDSVSEVILDDKSKISQRLTVTRMATLGVFSLAVPKKKTDVEYCLAIDWEDGMGVRQNALFEFKGALKGNHIKTLALNAANKFRASVKPKVQRLRETEMKCPFCAEIIKAEAKLCRYCRSDLA